MTRKPNAPPAPKPRPQLLISREEAKLRLQERQSKGLELRREQISSRDSLESAKALYRKWNDFNEELLKQSFSTEDFSDEYSYAGASGIISLGGGYPSLAEDIEDLHSDLEKKIQCLESIMERLELIPVAASSTATNINIETNRVEPKVKSSKVFIVHGHDEGAKTNLEVVLREMGLDPIVLHRQADEGLTLIEKFEKHSDVGYAFILLTPDEIAYLKAEEDKPDQERKKEFRARPNVIFEFGFFVGKLGRSKVCCLYTGNVTLPSDVNGIIYKKYEHSVEEVAYGIQKDLKASGYKLS